MMSEQQIKKILICQSSPNDKERLNCAREVQDIEEIIESTKQKKFEIKTIHASYGSKFQNYILANKPSIFHFTGHAEISGNETYLCFLDDNDCSFNIDPDTICNVLKNAEGIECIIINACNSYLLADKLAAFVPNVVGMKGKISDKSAAAFARGFYGAINEGKYYKEAFDAGVNKIKLEEGSDFDCPYLANVDFDINLIVDNILCKRCVLFVGPDFESGTKAPHQDFYSQLLAEYPETILKIHRNDNLFIFNENARNINRVKARIENYYKTNVFNRKQLEKIVQIPFHFIVSVTADTSLNKIMDEKNLNYDFHSHKLNTKSESIDIPDPTSEKPLIYNLFGCVNNESEPIISHIDLFEYLKDVFKNENIPYKIRNISKDHRIRTLIFVGFQFDKWYFQLLLWLLDLHQNKSDKTPYSFKGQSLDSDSFELSKSMFNIFFIDNNIDLFIDRLHEEFEKQGKLR